MVDPRGVNMPDRNVGRDPARSPMQWNDAPFSGFSKVRPWLPVDRLFAEVNVEAQKDDPHSLLNFYRRLIRLRADEPAFTAGDLTPVYSDHQIISYKRSIPDKNSFLIILNLTHRPCYFRSPQQSMKGTIEVCTDVFFEGLTVGSLITLEADQAMVIRLA